MLLSIMLLLYSLLSLLSTSVTSWPSDRRDKHGDLYLTGISLLAVSYTKDRLQQVPMLRQMTEIE